MTTGPGRRASLPTGRHQRPPVLEPGKLVVTHVQEGGRATCDYDFSTLPISPTLQRQLAELFAQRVSPVGGWKVIKSSFTPWEQIGMFSRWVATQQPVPQAIAEFAPAVWNGYLLSRAPTTSGESEVRTMASLLRVHPDLPQATRELVSKRNPVREPKEVAYTKDEFDRIKAFASRKFRKALDRIRENQRLLASWRAGQVEEGTTNWQVGEALDHIARTGDIPYRASGGAASDGRLRPDERYYRLLDKGGTWNRLFLGRDEIVALSILLVAAHGWNLTPILEMRVPGSTPNPGLDGQVIYRVELEKRRRGSTNRYETRNLTDWGPGSPGRLIAQAIEATEPARACLAAAGAPTDRLIVWRCPKVNGSVRTLNNLFKIGFDDVTRKNTMQQWLKDHGPDVVVNLRRLRKTVVALHQRTPTQHNQDTHDKTYVLPEPQTWEQSSPIISAGIEDALDFARDVVRARTTRENLPSVDDTATTSCSDYTHSPFGEAGAPCRASFLLCTACSNAVVTPRHLPRLAYLYQALDELRGAIAPTVWDSDWRQHHARLLDLKQRPDFTGAEWDDALTSVTAQDRKVIDQLLRTGYTA